MKCQFCISSYRKGLRMITDEKIKNSSELEFAVFCIENVAAKLGVASMSRRCMNRRRSGAASSNAVEKMVLSPGMSMMKAGKLN